MTMPTINKTKTTLDAHPRLASLCKNPFALLAIFCLVATPFLYSAAFSPAYVYAALVMIAAMLGVAVYLHRKGTLTTDHIVLMLFLVAMMLRVLYVLRFGHSERQHDTGPYTNTWGHIGYIKYFYENYFQIPIYDPTTVYGFYNPPLHHFLCAVFFRCISLVHWGISFESLAEAAQALTLFYSLCASLVGLKIAKAFGLKGNGYLIAAIIIILHPTLTIFSGSINNDVLCFLMILCTIYRAIKWHQDPTTKNIVIAALFMGFSMLAKANAVYVAPGLAVLFLYDFFKRKEWLKYVKQYALFAIISIPIGLWWMLRCYLLFDMPLNYVPNMGTESGQYLGTGLNRLFDFSAQQWQDPMLTKDTTNIFVSMAKTSLFGEWGITATNWETTDAPDILVPFATILFVVALLLILLSLCAGIWALCQKGKGTGLAKACTATVYLTTMAAYLVFCFAHPQLCTTDFRYIPITCFIGAISLGYCWQSKKRWQTLALALTATFGVLSTGYYLLLLVV